MILEVKKWPPGGAGILLTLKTWNFRYFLVDFDEFSPNFRWFLDDFWNFKRTLWHPNPMFGRSPVRQFCLPQNLTKHLETCQKLWKTFGKSQKEPRNVSKMDFLWISTDFHKCLEPKSPKQSKCVLYNFKFSQKRKYRFYSWKKGKPTAPSVPRRSPIQVLTRLNVA